MKSLAVQRLKKLEEQCIHHFKLINYDYVNIVDHYCSFGKLIEFKRPKGKKFRSLRSGNFIMFLKTNLGYLSQIALKSMQLLILKKD